MTFKVFQTGTALTAEDLNDALMEQAVITFADATARDNALPNPNPGMHCHLLSTRKTYVYRAATDGATSSVGGKWVEVLTAAGPSGTTQEGVLFCTSTTRPAIVDGRLIYETDTKRTWQGLDAGSGTLVWKYVRYNAVSGSATLSTARIAQSIPHNVQTEISGWDKTTANKYHIDPAFFTWTGGSGQYATTAQSGVYTVVCQVDSDGGNPGSSRVILTAMNGSPGWGWSSNAVNHVQRASGYAGAGTLSQYMSWTGYLPAGSPMGVDIFQFNTGSIALNYTVYFSATCIG